MKTRIWSGVTVVVVLMTWLLIDTYVTAREPMVQEQGTARETVLAAYPSMEISETTTYYGDVAVQVIRGQYEQEPHIAWVFPQEEGSKIVLRKESDGVSKTALIDKVKTERNPEKFLSVKLGIKDEKPVWSVVYIAQDGRQYYEFYAFQTGEFIESISLKRTT
ncbi:uncharacterized protein YpmB [Aureibacillus halotolerans]|uniref:Uncharacterized protein YpmB n=2 Tax=Aureibacillus halotolerans TaxID=1508390 RepID=A0A4R6U4W0_9BACI|nr:uncharacterized protein YpmB [Aureibacillus halotolerans]